MRRSDGKADTVAHLVLVCLAVYADGDGHARPSVATLAEDARLTPRATADALARLQDVGLIERAQELTGGTVVWRLNLSLRRGEEEQRAAEDRRESARRKAAERVRRHRARKAARNAEVERDVTPNQSVTPEDVTPNLDTGNAEPQRLKRSTSAFVTPSTSLQPQVTPATTSIELPMNCQRTAMSETDAAAPAAEGTPSRRDLNAGRADIDRLCEHLADRIEANGSRRPAITRRWRDEARLMLDRDGRTEQQVHAAIDWCQADPFWRANVLSMAKLRGKYDQLRLQAQRTTSARDRPSTTDQRTAAVQALKSQFRDHPTNQQPTNQPQIPPGGDHH